MIILPLIAFAFSLSMCVCIVKTELNHDILAQSPMFRLLGRELLLRLCEAVVPVSVVKAQTIFKRGDVGHEMYFIMRGEVEVTSGPDNAKLGFIGHGGFFGEKTVIEAVGGQFGSGSCVRGRSVSATTDSDLAMLETDTILDLCDAYPELEVRLRAFKRVGTRVGEKGKLAEDCRKMRRTLTMASLVPGLNIPRDEIETASAAGSAAGTASPVIDRNGDDQTAQGEVAGDETGVGREEQAEWMEAGRRLLRSSNGDLKLAIARLMGECAHLFSYSCCQALGQRTRLARSRYYDARRYRCI